MNCDRCRRVGVEDWPFCLDCFQTICPDCQAPYTYDPFPNTCLCRWCQGVQIEDERLENEPIER